MDEKQKVELYIPRKCSWSHRLIGAKDHASVQLNIGHLDDKGVYTGRFTTFALSGFVRAKGDGDHAMNKLAIDKKLMSDIYAFPTSQ